MSRPRGPRAARRVDAQVADHDRADGSRRSARAAQQGQQARDQLLHRERLDQVVVGAGLQAGDTVGHLVACGEDEDRRARRPPAAGRDRASVEVGHRDVEDDRRGRLPRRRPRAPPARRRPDGEALEAQGALEGLANGGVIVDDEDERGRGQRPSWVIVVRPAARSPAGV